MTTVNVNDLPVVEHSAIEAGKGYAYRRRQPWRDGRLWGTGTAKLTRCYNWDRSHMVIRRDSGDWTWSDFDGEREIRGPIPPGVEVVE
jgi:hypothetical protein